MRSLPLLSETRLRPSFLRTTPAKNPRTECCCHPVAFMITAIVAPCGRLSRPITSACLEAARDLGRVDFFPSSRFNRLLVVVCAFVLETCLVLAILVTSHRLRRQMTPSAPKPRGGQ